MAEIEESIRRFIKGEEECFSQIVRQWEKKVYNLAWRLLGNREDAQDAAQETFLSVFKSIKNLRDPRHFSTWIYRITLNQCRTSLRSRVSNLSLDDPDGYKTDDGEGASLDLPAVQHDKDPLETDDIINKGLMGLSEDHRTAIILKEYMGLSLEEVANVMNCPLSTAKSRLYHGLREVQRNLKHLGYSG